MVTRQTSIVADLTAVPVLTASAALMQPTVQVAFVSVVVAAFPPVVMVFSTKMKPMSTVVVLLARLCPDGSVCSAGSDCDSGVCSSGACQVPTCSDGVANGPETDVDCGNACGTCPDGSTCAADTDCVNSICVASICFPAVCGDGVQNGTETDTDCGGSCPGLPQWQRCVPSLPTVAVGFVRRGRVKAPTCSDSIKNADETDVDCGGPICANCPDGDGCNVDTDCVNSVCTGGLCQVPTCTDGTAKRNRDRCRLRQHLSGVSGWRFL